ncbi:sugar ABC transporter permease [Streptacidiphilus sp. ASG 303]|uniref:carbohydrate ABC transporter permease n=1 Tax=Streptacidiphilus sp. ASG 303 TaxID=2896847 RepID=UPI001E4A47D2|nr:sugar ABC transporter permease [Streptacidiphilus sp. ASG 303]MCD0483576.1 sugar ABC transporter permease [Streptacidiphilus sp. ASG 303]
MTQTITAGSEAVAAPRPAPHRGGSRNARRADRALTIFAAPSLLFYLLFTIGPLVAVFYLAFLRWPGLLAPHSWVGLGNFRRVLDDPEFWQACRTTVVHLIATVPVLVALSFMLGYYVSLNPPGARVLRVLLFIPGLLSLAAQATVFFATFAPYGLINSVLDGIGLGSLTKPWLADPSTALPSVIAVTLWGGIGYTSILFAAHLGGIDASVYEAAQLDGAGRFRTMWQIAFPMARGYVGVITMLQFLWNLFGSAGVVLLLTKGGPESRTTTLSYLVYEKAFLGYDVGYSQAVGVLLFAVGLIGIVVIRRVFRSRY